MPHCHIFLGAPSVESIRKDLCSSAKQAGHDHWEESEFVLEDQAPQALLQGPAIVFDGPTPFSMTGRHGSDASVVSRYASAPTSLPGTESRRFSIGTETQFLPLEASVVLLPQSTLKEATQKLSAIYENVIFGDDDEDVGDFSVANERSNTSATTNADDTAISWEPTPPRTNFHNTRSFSNNTSRLVAEVSFKSQQGRTADETKGGKSQKHSNSQEERTFNTESWLTEDDSGDYTNEGDESSSIGRFPNFHFDLHRLSSLSELLLIQSRAKSKERRLVTILVAVLEVEGPTRITTKKGVDMSLLKLIIGDESGGIAKVTVWRETAEEWGGGGDHGENGVRKGDVVLLENVSLTYDPPNKPTFSASPSERSNHIVCYRTLPIYDFDRKLRPDLRLAASELVVRRVAAVVGWIEEMMGVSSRG